MHGVTGIAFLKVEISQMTGRTPFGPGGLRFTGKLRPGFVLDPRLIEMAACLLQRAERDLRIGGLNRLFGRARFLRKLFEDLMRCFPLPFTDEDVRSVQFDDRARRPILQRLRHLGGLIEETQRFFVAFGTLALPSFVDQRAQFDDFGARHRADIQPDQGGNPFKNIH